MANKSKGRTMARNAVYILLGSVIYAAAISLFLDPNQLAPGGVTGIAIISTHLTGVNTGMIILAINIPLMALGAWKLGVRMLLSTMFTTFFSSFLVDLLAKYGPVTNDFLLASVAGGALLAVGMALVFKAGATTGGTDILVRLIKLRYPYIKTGKLFLLTDSVIVTVSALVFRNIDLGMYAAISIFIFSVVFDIMLYGADTAKMVYIITDEDQPIATRLLELEIGLTYLKGVGAYSGNNKRVILCAMKKQILPQVQEIVKEEDPDAFLIITSASEIFGEGFKDHRAQQL